MIKMVSLFLLMIICLNHPVFSQPAYFIESSGEVDRKPVFVGSGSEASSLKHYIDTNLNYPFQAMANCIEGLVVIEYILTAEGEVQETEFMSSVGAGCDEEALRIIRSTSGMWLPAEKDGKKADCRVVSQVMFKSPNPRCERTLDYYYKKANDAYYNQNYQRAINYFNHILRINPLDHSARLKRGISFLENGKRDKACFDWKSMEYGSPQQLIKKHCY